jgi:S-adenosyl methyltransferase
VPDFDTSVPYIARVYDYWLGGKDNFAADRELGERTLAAYPDLVYSVRANRAMRDRAGVTRLFDGLELVEPGVGRVTEWRPGSDLEAASPTGLWGGVARRP